MTFESFDQLYPGRFIKAGLFKGTKQEFTIEDVQQEELEGDKGSEMKVILKMRSQRGKPVELVLAKLNALCLREMFSSSVPAWIGKRIVLFPTADFAPMKKGEPCIRVWGSPDIDAPVNVTIKLPKRKAFDMTMRPTAQPPQQAAPPSQEQ